MNLWKRNLQIWGAYKSLPPHTSHNARVTYRRVCQSYSTIVILLFVYSEYQIQFSSFPFILNAAGFYRPALPSSKLSDIFFFPPPPPLFYNPKCHLAFAGAPPFPPRAFSVSSHSIVEPYMRCVAECCRVLQCSVLQSVAECCNAVCCRVLQSVAECCSH